MFKRILLILLIHQVTCNAQVLVTSFPQLNPGGQVHAVVEDTVHNIAFLAGRFNSVGGVPAKNLAAVDLNTYQVLNTFNPIFSMDSSIFSMALFGQDLYIGGDFLEINGNLNANFFAHIRLNFSNGTVYGNYSTNREFFYPNFQANNYGNHGVDQLLIDGNKLFIGHNYLMIDSIQQIHTFPFNYSGISRLDLNTRMLDSFIVSCWNLRDVSNMTVKGDSIYVMQNGPISGVLNGQGLYAFHKINGGCLVRASNINYGTPCGASGNRASYGFFHKSNYYFEPQCTFRMNAFPTGYGYSYVRTDTINFTVNYQTGNAWHSSCTRKYNHYAIGTGNTMNGYQGLDMIDLNTNLLVNWNSGINTSILNYKAISLCRNHLYVSDRSITSVYGQPRRGIAMYCLPPLDPEKFIQKKSTVCRGDSNVVYSVSPNLFASYFQWTYSGSGVSIIGSGNSVTLNFGFNATPGNLSVIPFSECGLPGDTLVLPINFYSMPPLTVLSDTTLNCVRDSVNLLAFAFVSGAQYWWKKPGSTYLPGNVCTANAPGVYYAMIREPIHGCKRIDSVMVLLDTVKPIPMPVSDSVLLNCQPAIAVLQAGALPSNCIVNWHPVNGGPIGANPDTVSLAGNYFCTAVHPVNGCRDSVMVKVIPNTSSPSALISSHPVNTLIIDTLTCSRNQIWVKASSDVASFYAEWRDSNGVVLSNVDSVLITQPGLYTLKISDAQSGCFSVKYFGIESYTTPPLLFLPSPLPLFGCNADSVLLNAASLPHSSALTWYKNFNLIGSNPTWATDTGWYVIKSIRSDNGCAKRDSFFLVKSNSIQVSLGNDTTLCYGDVLTIHPLVSGNQNLLNYYWPDGTTATTFTLAALSNQAIPVTVSLNSTCMGTDTLNIFISPAPTDSIVVTKDCGNVASGQIQVFLSDGNGPYLYSLDNGFTWNANNVFAHVPFGSYTLTVSDHLGCRFQYNTNLDQNSHSASANFLSVSRNRVHDTIVFVDVSNPYPDTIIWHFPQSLLQISSNCRAPFVLLTDTGTFKVVMDAIYDNCILSDSTTINVLPYDSALAGLNNAFGFISFTANPNPSSGLVSVSGKFHAKQDVSLRLYDPDYNLIWNNNFADVNQFQTQLNLNTGSNGVYLLMAVAEFETRWIYLVISH